MSLRRQPPPAPVAAGGGGRLDAVLRAGAGRGGALPSMPAPTAGIDDTPKRRSFLADLDIHLYKEGMAGSLMAGPQRDLQALAAADADDRRLGRAALQRRRRQERECDRDGHREIRCEAPP